MPVTHQPRRHTVCIQVGQTGHLQAEQHVEHGHIDVLGPRGMPLAGKQRRADCPGCIHPGTQIADGLAAAGRPGSGETGNAHQPGHGLRDDVISRATGQRALLAKAGNTGVDQPRVVLLEAVEIDAQALSDTGAEVLDHDIGIGHQFVETLAVGRVFKIDFNAAFAAIDQPEVDTFAVQKRAQMAGVIALLGHFELDDVGPQISQHRGAMRPGQHAADIQHTHTLQLSGKRTVVHFHILKCSSGTKVHTYTNLYVQVNASEGPTPERDQPGTYKTKINSYLNQIVKN